MFRIEMLPAAHGDCLWIEYGSGARVHRILIDGGPAHAYPALRERILHLPADARRFELLVITHIDADHIEGHSDKIRGLVLKTVFLRKA